MISHEHRSFPICRHHCRYTIFISLRGYSKYCPRWVAFDHQTNNRAGAIFVKQPRTLPPQSDGNNLYWNVTQSAPSRAAVRCCSALFFYIAGIRRAYRARRLPGVAVTAFIMPTVLRWAAAHIIAVARHRHFKTNRHGKPGVLHGELRLPIADQLNRPVCGIWINFAVAVASSGGHLHARSPWPGYPSKNFSWD